MRTTLLLLAIATSACAPDKPTGSCFFWSDCGEGGACEYTTRQSDEPLRFECSFADAGCSSGRRFGELASGDLANSCVDFHPSLDGLCNDNNKCDAHYACELGRCISVKQLDATGQLVGAMCSDEGAAGGDVYFWGIAFIVGEPRLFKPDALFADAQPYTAGTPYPRADARSITIGANHLCIVGTKDGGPAFSECFGRPENPAVAVAPFATGDWAVTNPLGVHSAVSGGTTHSCGIRADPDVADQIDCWGDDDLLQLDGVTPDVDEQTVAIGEPITTISVGKKFSCAGTTTSVWCWGGATNWTSDTFDGPKGTKARVVGLDAGEVTALDAGDQHACAIKNSQLWCWGINDGGQVSGDPTTTASKPVKPLGDTPVISVAAGGQHTCAVTADHQVLCWGSNVVGQLGPTATSSAPSVVPLEARPVGPIAAGDFTTCAVLEDSFVHCWGAPALTTDVELGFVGEPLNLSRFPVCTL